jgi:hypothetical protein
LPPTAFIIVFTVPPVVPPHLKIATAMREEARIMTATRTKYVKPEKQ